MNAKEAWEAIPPARRGELARFLIHGIRPGNTLWLVLSEHVFEAAQYADAVTLAAMGPIVRFCAQFAPVAAFGSGMALSNWMSLSQRSRVTRVSGMVQENEVFDAMLADSGLRVDA